MNTPTDLAEIETELLAKHARFTPLGLILPNGMAIDAWAAIGRKLCRAGKMLNWWLGDWAAFGELEYGQLKEFAAMNELDFQTLCDLAWVSRKVETSRRRDVLGWSFHREVAALPAKEQDRWLEISATEGLSVSELRSRIRLEKGERCALDRDGPAIKSALKSCDDLVHWLRNRPGDFWTADRKEAWRKNLGPIVDAYNTLL
jgi:hypothetical protein